MVHNQGSALFRLRLLRHSLEVPKARANEGVLSLAVPRRVPDSFGKSKPVAYGSGQAVALVFEQVFEEGPIVRRCERSIGTHKEPVKVIR